ncbi:MAG: hypothetical protein EOM25_14750 [Deltaproteobacteria bacterium]|nr:hypothetical protein [Deltaproteobacteria bacterium]
MSPAREKMVKARADLVLEHPFFATLALRLDLREDRSCATVWSDGSVLAYNPDYIETQPPAAVKGMQCHEVLHLACSHHTRRNGREAGLWNRACDYAINPILLEAGVKLPPGYLDDPVHHGRSADAIYEDLLRDLDTGRGGAENGAEQDAVPDGDMESASAGVPGLGGRDQSGTSGRADKQGPGLRQASGGGGEWAGPGDNADPGMSGEVRDASRQSRGHEGDQEGADQDDQWRMAMALASRVAREAGNMPGGLERLVESMLAPRLGWRDLLRRFVTSAARDDFSWVRPNRRQIHAGLYLPGLDSLKLAPLAVVVDVSGSVEQTLLDIFCAEISAVLEEFDTDLELLTCDMSLTSRRTLGRLDLPLAIRAKGGGGTDFRPPFKILDRDGVSPACLVYFTDMQCSSYPEEPDYPVLWVNPGETRVHPPFGEIVTMERP